MKIFSLIISKFNHKTESEKTTTLTNLRRIKEFIVPPFDPMDWEYSSYNVRYNSPLVKFENRNINAIDGVPLKSLKYIDCDGSGFHVWHADKSEYNRVYKSDFMKFIDKFNIFLDSFKDKWLSPRYKIIMIKYEASVSTVVNVLEECNRLNNRPTGEIEGKIQTILLSLSDELKEADRLEKEDEIKNREVGLAGLSELLDFELDYINKMKEWRNNDESAAVGGNSATVIL